MVGGTKGIGLLHSLEAHEDQYRETVIPALGMFSGDFNPHRFTYGAPTMYVLHAVWRIHYAYLRVSGSPHITDTEHYVASFFADPEPLCRLARFALVLFWLAAVWVTYLAGRRVGGPLAGSVTAVLVVCLGAAQGRIIGLSSDMPVFFVGALVVYQALAVPARSGALRHDAILGFTIGLGTAAKMLGLMLAGAYACWRVWGAWCVERRPWVKRVLVGMAGVLLGFAIGTPFAFLAWPEFMAAMSKQMEFNAMTGRNNPLLQVLHIGWTLVDPRRGLGPVALLAAVAAVVYILHRKKLRAGFLVWTSVIGAIFLCTQTRYQRNWLLPMLPALVVAAGLGTALVMRYLARRRGAAWQVHSALVLVLVLAPPLLFTGLACCKRMRAPNVPYAWQSCGEWVEANLPGGSSMLVVANPSSAPRLLPTADSPAQPRDEYLGTGTRSTAFLLACQSIAATEFASTKPSYRLYHRIHPSYWHQQHHEEDAAWRREVQSQWRPLGWYISRGVTYVLLDTSQRDRFDTDPWPAAQGLFAALQQNGRLLRSFESARGGSIEVWQLDS